MNRENGMNNHMVVMEGDLLLGDCSVFLGGGLKATKNATIKSEQKQKSKQKTLAFFWRLVYNGSWLQL